MVAAGSDGAILREKALLLLHRERELFAMRQGKSRAAAWLNVVFGLSQYADGQSSVESLAHRWTEAVIRDLHFQVAGWLTVGGEPEALRPIIWQTPSGRVTEARRLSPEVSAFLSRHGAEPCNDPSPACRAALASFGGALGLEKFHWFVAPTNTGEKLVMVAGFTVATGSYHSLEEEDGKYFRLLGEHQVIMIQNARLLADLRREQDALLGLTRHLEARISERTRELEDVNRSLSESLRRQCEIQEQLVQAGKMAGIGQLAAGVAHEVNNPLGVILGFAQGLERRVQDEGLRVPVASIVREARRCKALVQELLTFSRTAKRHVEAVDLNHLVGGAVVMLEAKAKTQNVRVVLELADGLPAPMANKTQLEQVIVNLGSNALDAMSCGGCLTLRTRPGEDGTLLIEVVDTGSGIPEEIRARIFEPFFTTKDVGRGTGLGLSLVHEILRQHGGSIDVRSEVDRGTTMRVKVPVVGPAPELADEQEGAR